MGYHTHTQCSVDCDHLGPAYSIQVSHLVTQTLTKTNTHAYTRAQTQQLPLIIKVVWLNTVIFNGVVCFVLDHFTQRVFEEREAAGWG